ncbi:hypothetical protein BGW80DRAFT_1310440, partial [Lactifluus volemus]
MPCIRTNMTSRNPETLEVEDVDQRQDRLQRTLERLSREAPSSGRPPDLSFDFGDRRTFDIGPPTELLARVQQFLPQIEQSNAELLQRDPRSIDIEHIEGTDECVIQMDLGLGVFEQQRKSRDSVSSSSSRMSGSIRKSHTTSDSSSTPSTSGSSSSSSRTNSEDEGDKDESSYHRRPKRPIPKTECPVIEVLSPRDQTSIAS